MDWDDARYVLALHRERTLSGAAATLGVTRTTVGRRLKSAEERLGVRLFDRTGEGLQPTAAGDELAVTATRVEAELQVAEGRLLGRDAELRGPLRVTTLDFVFAGFTSTFGSFVERYPHVGLTVNVSTVNLSLLRRDADVALRLGNTPAEGLFGRRVGRMVFEAYASRALAERIGSQAQLADYPWLHLDERSDVRWYDGWLAAHAPDARIALRSDDYAVRRRAIAQGIGVGFLACFDGDADPDLVRIGARLAKEAQDLWVLTLPELRHNRRIHAFMEHVHEAFEPLQAALAGETVEARARRKRRR